MLTQDGERKLIDKLCKKYLQKAINEGHCYTSYDLLHDVGHDIEFVDMEDKMMIDIPADDLYVMVREEYEDYFTKPILKSPGWDYGW